MFLFYLINAETLNAYPFISLKNNYMSLLQDLNNNNLLFLLTTHEFLLIRLHSSFQQKAWNLLF